MSDKLPQISGERMARVLVKLGFMCTSQKGSHMKFIRKKDKITETIIVYQHHVIKKGSLARMLRRLHLSIEELKELL